MVLRYLRSEAVDDWGHSLSSMMWLSRRGIRASRLEMKTRVRGCNIMLVDTSDLVLIGLHRHNRSVHSGCDQPLSQAEEHQYIRLL